LVSLFTLPATAHATDYLSRGNDHYRNGDFTKAISAYRAALSNNENPALCWFNLGNALYQSKSPHKAIPCYEAAVVEEPGFVRAWQNLGILYYELEDYGACIAALDHVLAQEPENKTALSVLAAAHKEVADLGMAAVYLERTIALDSSMSEAYLMLYDIARLTGDSREALDWLQKYPDNGSRIYDVLLLSSDLLVQQGDTTRALSALRRCTQMKPERSQGWLDLISLLQRMNATFSALLEAEKVVTGSEPLVPVALSAGRIAFEAGYYDKAERFYATAYHEGHADGVAGLGNLLLAYQRLDDHDGVQRVNEILKTHKENRQ
jgi:tetratricopeptide (TPR) repeat protein